MFLLDNEANPRILIIEIGKDGWLVLNKIERWRLGKAERFGHANIKMTLETYTHVLPGMQEGAPEQMSKMLYG